MPRKSRIDSISIPAPHLEKTCLACRGVEGELMIQESGNRLLSVAGINLLRPGPGILCWLLVLGIVTLRAAETERSPRGAGGQARSGAHREHTSPNASPVEPISVLQERIDQGECQLNYHPETGYLLSLLEELQISKASQLLVFSKTSCQRSRISPGTPRAIYFNDRAYVAWIPGSPMLEVSAVDPRLGAVFYTLEQEETVKPRLVRRDQCLECHTSNKTLGVPGYLVRSYATDEDGVINIIDGRSMVDHRTPLAERWGGWYLCGRIGALDHRGIAIGTATANRDSDTPSLGASRIVQLPEPAKYPQATSDVVALMVLEHQAHMQNLITRLQQESQPSAGQTTASIPDKGTIEAFLKYLLFVDEVALPGPVEGPSEFAAWFESQGPRDRQGRSLRQLDLETRLFKFPCSYMIYSDACDALPRSAKLHIYHRLWKILNGEASDLAFAAIPPDKRSAILEILLETKAGVPIYWKL